MYFPSVLMTCWQAGYAGRERAAGFLGVNTHIRADSWHPCSEDLITCSQSSCMTIRIPRGLTACFLKLGGVAPTLRPAQVPSCLDPAQLQLLLSLQFCAGG